MNFYVFLPSPPLNELGMDYYNLKVGKKKHELMCKVYDTSG